MAQNDFAKMAPASFVDLERYPVDRPDEPVGQELVRRLRATLQADGSCCLPGFIKSGVIEAMAGEIDALGTSAYAGRTEISPYEFDPEVDAEAVAKDYPEGHPRRRLVRRSFSVLAYKHIPESAMLRRLYWWDALPKLLAGILGLERIYRFEDEYQAINVLYMREGGEQQWHFDSNDFSITLLLQQAEAGGEFSYAPNIRTPKDENYAGVARLLDGDEKSAKVRTVPLTAGTLMIFRGKYSIHRATPVRGPRQRIQSVLCFDVEPGRTNLAVTNRRHYVSQPTGMGR